MTPIKKYISENALYIIPILIVNLTAGSIFGLMQFQQMHEDMTKMKVPFIVVFTKMKGQMTNIETKLSENPDFKKLDKQQK